MQGTSSLDRELLDAEAVVGHLVPAGSVHRFLADHRRCVFPDELFADLFGSGRGRPSVPAEVVATVLVLASLEGLSDREAAQALRTDLRWKVAAGLALDDEGFHPTVLTYWRRRLGNSDRPERIFEAVRRVVAETGVLVGKGRRALDSTLLDDAVATQDTVTQLVSMIRRVRGAVEAAAAVEVVAHDYTGSAKPACAWDDAEARSELVSGLVGDALAVLAAVEGVALDDAQQQLVALLALVAGQDVEPDPDRGDGAWRIARATAKDRVISVVDAESRHMHKSQSSYRDGYKAHVAVEPDTGIITACDLTAANVGDGPVGVELLAGEEPGLEVFADSAYGSGPTLAALEYQQHHAVIKPWPLRRNPRLGSDQFNRDDFTIDYDARTVTCPNNQTVPINESGRATFGSRCETCPVRSRCTASTRGRTLQVGEHDQLLAEARTNWRDRHHTDNYRQHRPLVERSIAWLVANGHRRVRYRGVAANRIGLAHRAAAVNLQRLTKLRADHNGATWHLNAA